MLLRSFFDNWLTTTFSLTDLSLRGLCNCLPTYCLNNAPVNRKWWRWRAGTTTDWARSCGRWGGPSTLQFYFWSIDAFNLPKCTDCHDWHLRSRPRPIFCQRQSNRITFSGIRSNIIFILCSYFISREKENERKHNQIRLTDDRPITISLSYIHMFCIFLHF